MKKVLCLALSLAVTLSIAMTGCGSKEVAETSTSAASTVEASATSAEASSDVPKDTVDLTWYLAGPQADPDVDLIAKKASEYLKDKLNVNLSLNVFSYGDAYDQKVNAMLAAGEAFDVCFSATWTGDYRNNSHSGYFLALDDYLSKNPAIYDIAGKDFIDGGKIDGKTYGVQTNKEQAHSWGLLLKKDLAEKYKVDTASIKKIADLEPVFEQIKKNEAGITPLLTCQMDSPYQILDWDTFSSDDCPGALYTDESKTTVVNQFLEPVTVEFYKQMQNYYKKGYLPADGATLEAQVTQMTSGKYFAASSSMKPGKNLEMKTSTNGIDWVQLDLTKPVKSNREINGAVLCIPKNSANPDRAFKFIEMLYTDKTLRNMFSFGIEGTHYEKVSDDVIKMKDGQTGYASAGNGWRFGDQFKDFLTETEKANMPDKWDQFKKFNESATTLKSLGFSFATSAVETEIAACKSVVQNHYKQLFAGSVKDVDAEVAAFDKELKAAGVEKVLKEMQTQYDAFLASK